MTSEQQYDRWAPWWAYVIAIGATNQVHMGLTLATVRRRGCGSSSASCRFSL